MNAISLCAASIGRPAPYTGCWGSTASIRRPTWNLCAASGELHNRRQFRDEAAGFIYHPGNGTFFRKVLRLRVSTRRMQEIFDELVTAGRSPKSHSRSPEAGGAIF